MTDDPWLTTEELAARLHVKVQTVHYWRHLGVAPKGTRLRGRGGRTLYRLSDVVEWEHQREEAERKGA